MGTNPNKFGYSVFVIYIYVLNLSIGNIDAQNIVSFPTGQSLNNPLSSNIVDEQSYTLTMTGATTTRDNETICTGFNLAAAALSTPFWIIQFEGVASTSVVHHMTLYGCAIVPTKACGCGMEDRSPLYSWVRNSPKVRYTGTGSGDAGGFRIGGTSDKQYLFLEIHYCHKGTTNDQSGIIIHTTTTSSLNGGGILYDVAIFPIMGKGTIPANRASVNIDTCITTLPSVFDGTLVTFGFQVHTHNLGRLVSAYYLSGLYEGSLFILGQGNPLWPEAYVEIPYNKQQYPSNAYVDLIYTRCVYASSGTTSDTNTNGPILPKTPWQEMCMFNLLVYSNTAQQFSTKNAFLTGNCNTDQVTAIDGQASSTTLITPAIPALDIAAAYGNITSGTYPYGAGYSINMGEEKFTQTFTQTGRKARLKGKKASATGG